MDLFASDVGGISSGNMRDRSQESINAGIQARHEQLAGQIASLKQQREGTEVNQAISGLIGTMVGGSRINSGMQEYKNFKEKAQTKLQQINKVKASPNTVDGEVNVEDDVTTEARPQTTTEAPATASPEGTSATPSSNLNPTAEEHEVETVGADGEGKGGSLLGKGLSNLTGLSDDAVEAVGRGVGALGSIGTAGLDIYKDITNNQWSKNNAFQDVGQVAQIGGAIADTIGIAFPPAMLVGGALDVAGAVTNEIGDLFESGKEKAKQVQQQAQQKAQEAKAQVQAPAQAQVVAARTEG